MQPVGSHNARKPASGGEGSGGAAAASRGRTDASIPGLSSPFAHLHCRSWFSFLAGASSPEALAATAAKRGIGALALTDINGIYGVVRFQKACREAGVKPIFGSEVNVEGAPLVLIASDETGLRNLNLMLTAAHQRSREDPQVRLTELMEHADGLFCLTGAYGSRLYELIDGHEREAAYRWVRQLHCMFEDRFSIEVATHIHPGDRRRTNTLERLSRETYVPLVATGDVRYARSEDYRRYDLMTCTRLGITIFDDHPERPRNAEAYLRAEEGMRKLIPFPEAFLRAREIADACTLDLIPGYITPPAASVPPPHSPREYLRKLCWTAFGRRYPAEHDENPGRSTSEALRSTNEGGGLSPGARTPPPGAPARAQGVPAPPPGAPAPLPEDPQREKDDLGAIRRKASAQLEKELGVIGRLELDEFFLVVHEIVDKARELGIRCAGRGSAANSIVAYLLGITGVDPVRNNLLFERFLHAGRKGTPDIDVDFDSERREEIIAWIEERFGMEQTAMTATLITYRVRSAIRDTAKAFGWPMETVNRLSKAVPSYSGRDLTEQRVRLEQITGPSPLLDKLLEMAAELTGAPRHLGLHSGGMILSREPLHHFTPVQVSANGVKVVQFDKNDVEALGLVKFDVLGLRMLATLSEADELIRRHEPVPDDGDSGEPALDIDELPLDDIRTFNMIRASKTLGVFQIESQGQLHLLAQHQPEDFKDLINEIALFRPGPLQSGMVHPFVRRRRGQEEVTYDHPLLEPILKDTYGVIVFQEQVLEVAHRFANMALEEADEFRRLMSKFRDPGEMEGMRDRFVEGAMRNGVTFETATKVFENVANFVGYGFCRSHAAAFAKTVYQSAYLKRHHTAAFMAAFMQHRPGMYNQMTLEEEARRFGVPTLLPHINRSGSRFDLERVPAPSAERRRTDGEAVRLDREMSDRRGRGAPRDRDVLDRETCGRTDDDRLRSTRPVPTRLAIRKPLAAIQGVSAEDARAVVWERMTAGPFVSVRDFYERIELSVDQFRHIARSGALDELAGDSRRALWEIGLLNRSVGHPGRRRASTLFDLPPFTEEDVPELPALSLDERLSWDYETHSAARVHPMTLVRRTLNEYEIRPIASCFELGRVAGGRPLSMGKGGLLGKAFADERAASRSQVPGQSLPAGGGGPGGSGSGAPGRGSRRNDSRDGPIVTVAGIAMLRQRPKTANGVFFLTLEDETGFIQTVIYSKVLEALDHVFSQSSLIVRGRLQVMGNWRGLVVSHAWPLNGILGGYEGHASMGGGRDRMIKRLEDSPEKVDLFGARAGTKPG